VLSSTVPSTCAVNSRTIRASLAFMAVLQGRREGERPHPDAGAP
jgi:hypothetical protein